MLASATLVSPSIRIYENARSLGQRESKKMLCLPQGDFVTTKPAILTSIHVSNLIPVPEGFSRPLPGLGVLDRVLSAEV